MGGCSSPSDVMHASATPRHSRRPEPRIIGGSTLTTRARFQAIEATFGAWQADVASSASMRRTRSSWMSASTARRCSGFRPGPSAAGLASIAPGAFCQPELAGETIPIVILFLSDAACFMPGDSPVPWIDVLTNPRAGFRGITPCTLAFGGFVLNCLAPCPRVLEVTVQRVSGVSIHAYFPSRSFTRFGCRVIADDPAVGSVD